MGNTHYLHIVGDPHITGGTDNLRIQPPSVGSPLFGGPQAYTRLAFNAPPGTPPVLNTIMRGATSLAIARVVKIYDTGNFVVESLGTNTPGLLNVPGSSFAPSSPPFAGEVVNFDTGGSGVLSPFMGGMRATPSYTTLKQDARYETFTPENPADDNVFWDRSAKQATQILVLSASITGPGGAGPPTAESFCPGDRVTCSSGGSFTLLRIFTSGGDFSWAVVRKTGSITAGATLTNTRNAAVATISSAGGAVGADHPVGMWVPYHHKPNLGGTGTFFEQMPWGDGGEIAIFGPIVRNWWLKYKVRQDLDDRGVRVLRFSSLDTNTAAAKFTFGGVTVQTVQCDDVTFPTTWTLGETVTGPGGWSATLLAFSVSNKMLFVYDTNGATLGTGTITGSGSSTTAHNGDGAAYGWQPGSKFWNDWVAEVTAAKAATNATFMGSTALDEGMVLCPWEGELGPFFRGCPLQSTEFMANQWRKLIAAFRTYLNNSDLPVAIGKMDIRQHSNGGTFPISALVGFAIDLVVQTTSKVYAADTIGLEGQSTLPLPFPIDFLALRPEDYREWGERIWRALQYGTLTIPESDFDSFDLIWGLGHSFCNGGFNALWGFQDRDADLFPSAVYPNLDTSKPSLLNFNTATGQWQVYDVQLSANTFLGHTGFGPEAPVLKRSVRRFAQGGALWGRVGNVKTAYNGSTINGGVHKSPASWDPAGTNRLTLVVTLTVTAFAATSMQPARGRFTGVAGTFSGSLWIVGAWVEVGGSTLGLQGGGGNNSAPWRNAVIHAVATDGSWIEIAGSFVNEGSHSYTLKVGPFALWPEVVKVWRAAKMTAATQLVRTPKPKLKWVWCAEVDMDDPVGFKAALHRVLAGMDDVFDDSSRGEDAIGTVIMRMTKQTSWPGPDANIPLMQAAQEQVASERTALGKPTIVIDTDDLPMEAGRVFPPVTRLDGGLHHTTQGSLDGGFRLDKAAAVAGFLPPHPDGELDAVVIGGAGDSVGGDGGAEDDQVSDGDADGGTDGTPLTVQSAQDILSVIDDAVRDGADVASYTVNGRTVELRSLDELLKARRFYQAEQAKASGLRRTRVGFSR